MRPSHQTPTTASRRGYREVRRGHYDSFKEFFQPCHMRRSKQVSLRPRGIATTLDTVSQIARPTFPDLNPDAYCVRMLWNDLEI